MKLLKPLALCLALIGALALSQIALASGSPPATASGASAVRIHSFAFHPGTLRVSRGARVVFANSDRIGHTATDRGVFDTGVIQPGQRAIVRFRRRGVFRYVCRIHPFMHGKIVVR